MYSNSMLRSNFTLDALLLSFDGRKNRAVQEVEQTIFQPSGQQTYFLILMIRPII